MIRYEVLPVDGIEEQVIAHVPHDVTVTVTASPARGLEATLSVVENLAAAGYQVVPHLSARMVRDAAHLDEIVARLEATGVHDAFVPAGDATEPGQFPDAASLLRALRGAHLGERGITGYPESHHFIDDETTISAMYEKAPMATYIVSQICFDPATIEWWVRAVRARGTTLPIWIGVPGVVHNAKLLRVSMKIGLGESARFLRAHRAWLRRLITHTFSPDPLLRELRPLLEDPAANVAGLHVFTFNELERTERWRQRTLVHA
ncbi:MAG TPA: methylenetetrahydrofolate reductase [Solirubrobacteraceae bacterium]|nr:methylenetetrahydrofolate reductase [Solirubrobacteraceae bacterium]